MLKIKCCVSFLTILHLSTSLYIYDITHCILIGSTCKVISIYSDFPVNVKPADKFVYKVWSLQSRNNKLFDQITSNSLKNARLGFQFVSIEGFSYTNITFCLLNYFCTNKQFLIHVLLYAYRAVTTKERRWTRAHHVTIY